MFTLREVVILLGIVGSITFSAGYMWAFVNAQQKIKKVKM